MKRHAQAGFSIITAVFLVTILAALAVTGLQMLRQTQNDATLDFQWQRARQAALAGIQTGFWLAAQGGTCNANLTIADLPGTLAPYTVSVTCTADGPYTDGALPTVMRYRLQAVACNKPAGGAVACPNNGASGNDGYVEAVATGECVVKGAVSQCR